MVKYSENWRPHRCNCPSKLLVGWWWRVVVVSLIGPWLEPCFHLWTKPRGQESDLPRDSWLEGQLHAKHVADSGSGYFPRNYIKQLGKEATKQQMSLTAHLKTPLGQHS